MRENCTKLQVKIKDSLCVYNLHTISNTRLTLHNDILSMLITNNKCNKSHSELLPTELCIFHDYVVHESAGHLKVINGLQHSKYPYDKRTAGVVFNVTNHSFSFLSHVLL